MYIKKYIWVLFSLLPLSVCTDNENDVLSLFSKNISPATLWTLNSALMS